MNLLPPHSTHTYLQTEAPARGLLCSCKEVEIQHLIHEMFLLSKQVSNRRHRTPDIVRLILKLAQRVNTLGYELLWDSAVVGGIDKRYDPARWQLLEEYVEPVDALHVASMEYARMKAEINRMTIAEAQEQLRLLRLRKVQARKVKPSGNLI